MSMKEKIARALAKGAYENMLDNAISMPANMDAARFVEEVWPHWLGRVEMVLDAMREPTEGMVEAAWPKLAPPAECHYSGMWSNMIDAAREGK